MSGNDAGVMAETARACEWRLATAQAEGRAPSMVAAVVRDGRVVWDGARGELPEETTAAASDVQYRIGSISKTLTAVLVLRLRDEGLLDLGDRIGAHLDVPHGADATVAQLLSHTGGLAAEGRGPWWERTPGELRPELADVFGERPQKHPAGRRYHYSNPGYALLGALVERLRGRPWAAALRDEVLLPLGLTRTGYAPSEPHARGWAVHPYADARQPEPTVDTGRLAPAGQLWSTAVDLATFAAFLTAGDPNVLSADTLAEMRAPAAAPEPAGWDGSYGLGVQLLRHEGRLLAGHGGSMPGFVASLWTLPEERIGAVVLANATSGPNTHGLATGLLDEVLRREPTIPEVWRPDPAPDPELVALTGVWYWGTTAYELRLRAGRALSLAPAGFASLRSSGFRPEPDGTWTGLAGYFAGETLRVGRDEAGAVTHLDLGTFVFTRSPYDPVAPVPGGTHPDGWR
ncbi:serine hydrolase domain-containing protein [Streptomyces sp. NPDC127098]|uniref:serine hydrolase domain-containing protein n=1 Tax=Streptomyces sp. NPDC127098 TaxID=3347137 RepID=UPI00364E2448